MLRWRNRRPVCVFCDAELRPLEEVVDVVNLGARRQYLARGRALQVRRKLQEPAGWRADESDRWVMKCQS